MRRSLDAKSLAIGILAGAVGVAALGAAQTSTPQVGRFKITAARDGNTSSAGYVVDTVTGQVWSNDQPNRAKEFYAPKLGLTDSPAN